jgi:hypothetical protein
VTPTRFPVAAEFSQVAGCPNDSWLPRPVVCLQDSEGIDEFGLLGGGAFSLRREDRYVRFSPRRLGQRADSRFASARAPFRCHTVKNVAGPSHAHCEAVGRCDSRPRR